MLPLLLPIITTLAPLAAKAIGSALGGGAGKAIAASIEPAVTSAALQATGQTTVEAATAILTRDPNSPEAKAFVQRMNELANQVQLAEIRAGLERQRLENENRNSARTLLAELARMGSINAYFMPFLTVLVIVGSFGFFGWVLLSNLGFDERKSAIVNIIIGALIYALRDTIGFWTGSNAGSKMKDAQIAAIPPSPAPPPAPAPAPLPDPQSPPQAPQAPVSITVSPAQPQAPQAPPQAPQEPSAPKPSRFGAVIGRVQELEGGYVDDPNDNGGCTNMGVTIGTLRGWRKADVTCDDVRALTWDEAQKIYRTNYWNACSCDQLPCGVDFEVFDIAVNAGPGRAARLLQEILQKYDATISVDGIIGPLTIAAAHKVPPAQLVEMLYAARMAHYRSLDDWRHYANGWTKRADRVLGEARSDITMAKA